MRAAEAEGVPFALNARTDVIAHAGDDPSNDVIAHTRADLLAVLTVLVSLIGYSRTLNALA